MTVSVYVTKGTRVSFRFMKPNPIGTYSLAGAQAKFACEQITGEGVIRNIWADDPAGKKNLRFNVQLDDGTYVEVPSGGLTGVVR